MAHGVVQLSDLQWSFCINSQTLNFPTTAEDRVLSFRADITADKYYKLYTSMNR